MRASGNKLILSATDLSNFLSCRHRTALELSEAYGKRQRPHWDDPLLDVLFKRGLEHEKAYVESLQGDGQRIVDLSDLRDRDSLGAETLGAMCSGADVIVQTALRDGHWYGRPDLLRRVERPSALGSWSYETRSRDARGNNPATWSLL